MSAQSTATEEVFRLSAKIQLVPIRHGSGDMAQEVREMLLIHRVDCLAVPLPPSVEQLVEEGIAQLPQISLVAIPEPAQGDTSVYSYLSIDPCQPVIMAIRVAMGESVHRAYIDREVAVFEPKPFPGPDPYSLKHVSLAAFASALLPFMPYPNS